MHTLVPIREDNKIVRKLLGRKNIHAKPTDAKPIRNKGSSIKFHILEKTDMRILTIWPISQCEDTLIMSGIKFNASEETEIGIFSSVWRDDRDLPHRKLGSIEGAGSQLSP